MSNEKRETPKESIFQRWGIKLDDINKGIRDLVRERDTALKDLAASRERLSKIKGWVEQCQLEPEDPKYIGVIEVLENIDALLSPQPDERRDE